ncbi:MAG: threonine synthase [Myxococcota bacterium]
MPKSAHFRCIAGCATYPLDQPIYNCETCGALLEVCQPNPSMGRSAAQWREILNGRRLGQPGPQGSGVWRFHEWVLPELPQSDIVTLGEGGTPLVQARRLGAAEGIDLTIKQCGHTLSGSFKDLGMTVLVSQVHHMRQNGRESPGIVCASTGDTSAALAAYGAAAGLRTLVLLPKGKISAAQLVQPLAHGAKVIAIDSDFDGCMRHVQRLAQDEGIYLANSKNSLRIEGQKTVAFEIAEGFNWSVPDWVAIPGGNLGNVSALVKGFTLLRDVGLIERLPRVVCAQAAAAAPLYHAYRDNLGPLKPVVAQNTQATAIRIGDPVSFPKAIAALRACDGVVESVTEQELTEAASMADETGLYLCPHTAVAMAAVRKLRRHKTIQTGERVVVIATAHGLKFTEFKRATASNQVPEVNLRNVHSPIEVDDNYDAVRRAALA